jgi:hypothetical protein
MNNTEKNLIAKSESRIRDFYRTIGIGLLIAILLNQYGTPSGYYIIVGIGIARIIQIFTIILMNSSRKDYE